MSDVWLGLISSVISGFNLFAITFITSFKLTLQRLSGLKSLIDVGLHSLGIRTNIASALLPIHSPTQHISNKLLSCMASDCPC